MIYPKLGGLRIWIQHYFGVDKSGYNTTSLLLLVVYEPLLVGTEPLPCLCAIAGWFPLLVGGQPLAVVVYPTLPVYY